MPRQFENIESGGSLSVRLESIAFSFIRWIHRKRLTDGRDLDRPISTAEIRARFPEIHSGSDIRALVNFARANRYPILARLSSGGGYYFGMTPTECQENIASLREREKAIAAAREGLENAFSTQLNLDFE